MDDKNFAFAFGFFVSFWFVLVQTCPLLRGSSDNSLVDIAFHSRREDAPGKDLVVALYVDAAGQGFHPLGEVFLGAPLLDHGGPVFVDLIDHRLEVVHQVRAEVQKGRLAQTGTGQERKVLARPGHLGGGVAVGEILQDFFVGTVGAHDVGKDKGTARLQDALELQKEGGLVGRVAENLAGNHVGEFVGPVLREAVVEIAEGDVDEFSDAEFFGLLEVHVVLFRGDVGAHDLAPEALGDLVRDSPVAGSEIEDDRVLGDGAGPVERGQQSVVGGLRCLVDGVGGLSEDPVVDVEPTAAHHVLVKDAGVLFVVCGCVALRCVVWGVSRFAFSCSGEATVSRISKPKKRTKKRTLRCVGFRREMEQNRTEQNTLV
mmetsp:Transcript_116293/g.237881  ORF Transcript_116293/g.237881 Transcript_116293/m.237881 type:complete len:373 (+) Transcript_116293:3093-4211(+)